MNQIKGTELFLLLMGKDACLCFGNSHTSHPLNKKGNIISRILKRDDQVYNDETRSSLHWWSGGVRIGELGDDFAR